MIDINKAMLDPSEVFAQPEDVVNCQELSIEEKIKVLCQWEYDEHEMAVAEEENMGSNNEKVLVDRIHRLLMKLGHKH